jgi:NAD(P)-dependent dehydrogenase (short-subunit alcohol dehydrogenase family)
VESFSRVAAVELAPYKIRVNTIRPGLIDTQPKPLPPLMRENLEKRIPTLLSQRPGTAEEVGNVALFLASSLASYMTGTVVTVDGGALCGSFPSQQVIDDDSRYQWIYD